MKKDFILGIGSQRAGSTFLARLLNQHPNIAIHPLKELHYFDTIFGFRDEKVLKDFSQNQLNREINKLCDAEKFNFITDAWQWYLRTNLKLYTTPVAEIQYFDLFSDIFENPDVDIIGESTPEYMLLNRPQIRKVKKVIGADARIVMICRNPIKRMISSFRLLLEYSKQDVQKSTEQCDQLFLQLIERNDIWIKRQMIYNDYRRAIENYKFHFRNVLVLSYDDVVDAQEKLIQEISDFVNLDFQTEDMKNFFKRKVNSLAIKYTPSSEVTVRLEELVEKHSKDAADLFQKPLIY